MAQSDIILTFSTVIYGMMLLELGTRLHKLLRNRESIKWHYLPLLTAWLILIMILKNWWYLSLNSMDISESSFSILEFIFNGHLLVLFYLLTTSVLPDKMNDNNLNLKTFYFNNRKYFWSIFSLSILMIFFNTLYKYFTSEHIQISEIIGILFFCLLSIILIKTKKNWVHLLIILFFIAKNILEIISLKI